jgi:hypothetical protein
LLTKTSLGAEQQSGKGCVSKLAESLKLKMQNDLARTTTADRQLCVIPTKLLPARPLRGSTATQDDSLALLWLHIDELVPQSAGAAERQVACVRPAAADHRSQLLVV